MKYTKEILERHHDYMVIATHIGKGGTYDYIISGNKLGKNCLPIGDNANYVNFEIYNDTTGELISEAYKDDLINVPYEDWIKCEVLNRLCYDGDYENGGVIEIDPEDNVYPEVPIYNIVHLIKSGSTLHCYVLNKQYNVIIQSNFICEDKGIPTKDGTIFPINNDGFKIVEYNFISNNGVNHVFSSDPNLGGVKHVYGHDTDGDELFTYICTDGANIVEEINQSTLSDPDALNAYNVFIKQDYNYIRNHTLKECVEYVYKEIIKRDYKVNHVIDSDSYTK